MRRKIACCVTTVVTIAFMILRIVAAVSPSLSIGPFSLENGMIAVAMVTFLVTSILCFSKNEKTIPLGHSLSSLSGWIATFSGAMLIMSVVLDVFCWAIYHQVPPPNSTILNNVDLYSLIFSLVFGAGGGVFLILQGFNWMAESTRNQTLLSWLSLAHVLWMWFRLARYEISYASTIDISHSFFDFAALVTASLFFLHLARAITGVGSQPKNGLIILALFTTISSLSGAPLTFYKLSQGASIGTLLIAIVDATIGLLAFVIAISQAFFAPEEDASVLEQEPNLAWTDPVKERAPLDPPFSIDEKLPVMNDEEEPAPTSSDTVSSTVSTEWTVDDILAELDKNN